MCVSDADKFWIALKYVRGDPIKNIAADHGVTMSYPGQLARRWGILPRPFGRPRNTDRQGEVIADASQ